MAAKIDTIIFDLGGVLLNLDFEASNRAFAALGVTDFASYFQQAHAHPLFAQLETGHISPTAFYDAFREHTGIPASNASVEAAWNAMLLDFRHDSIAYLRSLQGKYRLFLLSNTNQIHLECFRSTYHATFGSPNFDDHFEKAWYSHELGLRKPHATTYTAVLHKHGLTAATTLFVDDTIGNIEGAQEAGLQTLHLAKDALIENAMPPLLEGV